MLTNPPASPDQVNEKTKSIERGSRWRAGDFITKKQSEAISQINNQ
jgi:hypothetical protein